MTSSLRNRTVSGLFWSFLQMFGTKGINFVVTLLLARILSPNDFGLIGMLTIFILVSQNLLNAGFMQALLQKKDVDEEDYSSVFYINVIISIMIYLILYFTAPVIALFYHQPVLKSLTRVLSLIFFFNAFSYIQNTRLIKEFRFKTLMLLQIPSTIVGGIVSLGMANYGFGVWSIVALQLVSRFFYSVQIWIYSKWKPLLSFNKRKARALISFGGNMMISDILNTVYTNVYLLVIGKFFPLSNVGYYQNANNLVQYPASTLSGVVGKVSYPVFASVQDDDRKLKEGYRKIFCQCLFWLCPVFVLSGVLAVPLFRFVFTEKWLPAVPYFRLLCIVGILYPLNAFNPEIVSIKGHSDIFLRLTLIVKLITTIGIFVSISFGIWALLIFQAANAIFAYLVNSSYSGKFIQYPIKEQMMDVLPIFLISIIIGTIVFFLNTVFHFLPDIVRLFLGFGIGGGLYWLIVKRVKLEPYMDFVQIVRDRLSNFSFI